ncbi:hypothetical protein [Actinomadura rudentiformis]|nr:hypothetical protein [Actinomadura rudentiformis]
MTVPGWPRIAACVALVLWLTAISALAVPAAVLRRERPAVQAEQEGAAA